MDRFSADTAQSSDALYGHSYLAFGRNQGASGVQNVMLALGLQGRRTGAAFVRIQKDGCSILNLHDNVIFASQTRGEGSSQFFLLALPCSLRNCD